MKLRIKNNSLRLRLTQSEIQQLDAQGWVEGQTQFLPTSKLIYRLIKDTSSTWIKATYDKNLIQISIPANMAQSWISTNQVGLEHHQDLGNDERLHLLIEKDFHCLIDRPNEDESDHFPNPLASAPK